MNYYQEIRQIKEIYRNKLTKPERGWPANVQEVLACQQNNLFAEKLSVGWMNKQCYISNKNFASQFAYYVGKTPQQYYNYHRMEVAKQLLSKDDLKKVKISTIAHELGYSLTTFSKCFKRETGMAPSRWREDQIA